MSRGAPSAWRTRLRTVENRLLGGVLDAGAHRLDEADAVPWDASRLGRHEYALLVSFRRSGQPVATPVWLAAAGELVYVRSGAHDGKMKRIRREPRVLIAPCTFRGRPTGPPMRGRARVLGDAGEEQAAEHALRQRYGLRRRIYAALRDPALQTAYLEIGAEPAAG